MIKRGLLSAALALLLLSPAARANDASLGRIGETVRPIRDTQVRLAAEDVQVRVTWERAYVEAVFTFHNTGPATTVLMGFPEHAAHDEFGFGSNPGLHDFRTWVDGVEVSVRREPGLVPEVTLPEDFYTWYLWEQDFPAWHTWEVDFAPGQTREVRNTCWTRHTFWSHGEVGTGYILVTGATWHGTIGRARVTLAFDGILPFHLTAVTPDRYRFEGTGLVWEWTDFEPTANIRLMLDSRGMLAVAGWYLPDDAGHLEELHRAGEHEALLARVQSLRDTTTPEQDPILQLYLARAYQGLGWKAGGEAVAAWERLVELAGREGQEYTVARAALPEALYHLAVHRHAAGDRAGVEAIYRQLRETRASLVVQRWLETLLPPQTIRRNPPVVTAKLGPEPTDPQSPALWLRVEVEDPDGDVAELRAIAWVIAGDQRETVLDERLELEAEGYQSGHWFFVGEIPPGARVEYRVEATDAEGLQGVAATSGTPADNGLTRPAHPWLWVAAVLAALVLAAARLLPRRKGTASGVKK